MPIYAMLWFITQLKHILVVCCRGCGLNIGMNIHDGELVDEMKKKEKNEEEQIFG